MKLRSRILLLALSLSLIFGIALAGTMLARAFHQSLDGELDRGVRTSGMFAASLQASLNAFASLGDADSARRAIRITASYMTDLAMVAVTDAGGQLLFDNYPPFLAPLMDMSPDDAGQYRALVFQDEPYQLIRRQVTSSQGNFGLVYAWSLRDVYDGARDQTRQAVVLLLGLGGMLLAVLALSMRAVFSPLRKLEDAAGKVAGGDFSARAPVVHPQDEVGRVSQRFNAMAEATQHHVAELTQRDAAQKQFIADMAHELKTPLTSMIGYADLMRRSDMPEDRRQQALHAIVTQGERLEQMRFKLLHLAWLNGGQAAVMKPEHAADLLEEAAQGMESTLAEKGIQLQMQCGDEVWHCDRDLIITLVQNLLSNAVKASAAGQRIWLSAGADSLTVRDEGAGIPPEHLPRVTEAFYMVDKSRSRSQQGAGLGLALCQRIARLHGGQLLIDSPPGQGTQVRMIFTSP